MGEFARLRMCWPSRYHDQILSLGRDDDALQHSGEGHADGIIQPCQTGVEFGRSAHLVDEPPGYNTEDVEVSKLQNLKACSFRETIEAGPRIPPVVPLHPIELAHMIEFVVVTVQSGS